MAERTNFKVSYVKIAEDGLERYDDVMLNDITAEERKDIKSLIFLPINSTKVWDISKVLKGFPILEYLYLPSTMTTNLKKVGKDCPMLKNLLMLTHKSYGDSLDRIVVKVSGYEEEGDNTSHFRTFVENGKDGKQTFVVNSKHIINHEIEVVENKIERLSPADVEDYISGEKGLINLLTDINSTIEDERCRIEIDQVTLESLLNLFVDKGVTLKEFTIDFSKLYDKIESYKSIAKSVNQVAIKEEIEGLIVETYQNVLKTHYNNLLCEHAPIWENLLRGTTIATEELFQNDLVDYLLKLVVESPDFDEDFRESSEQIESILREIPSIITRNMKYSKYKGSLKRHLMQVISKIVSDKDSFYNRIDERLQEKIDVDRAKKLFAKKFSLDVEKKNHAKLVNAFVEALVDKNFGSLTKIDVTSIIQNIVKEMGSGEFSGKEFLSIIKNKTAEFVTSEELKSQLVEKIAKNGYSSIIQTEA